MKLFCDEFNINIDQYALEDLTSQQQQQYQNTQFLQSQQDQQQANTEQYFNDKRHEYKSDLDILTILAKAKEFENIKVRQEEIPEIKKVVKQYWVLEEKLELDCQAGGAFDVKTDHQTLLESQQ